MTPSDYCRKIARDSLNGKWGLAVGTSLVALLLGANIGSGSSFEIRGDIKEFFNSPFFIEFRPIIYGIFTLILIWSIFTLFLSGAIKLGYCRFNMNLVNGTNPQFNDLFSRFDIFWKAFGLRMLTTLYIILWFILLIIPGIIAAYSYAMAPYIMAENPSIGISEAISVSKRMMYGNKWRLFCLHLSFIGWAILSALTLGIGSLWLNPYINASEAVFYFDVSGRRFVANQMVQPGGDL